MKIAVEGCAHGELDNIYDTIKYLEEKQGFKVDLLICCGDFQSSRNEEDLRCMAVPPKYYKMCSFYKYYSGEKTAPILTIFIGGNHEASNYLQELPYGGWVAPNIFYMGYAGVINIAGIRIGGLSGIYKGRDYLKGHFEYAPYNDNSKRSVYHIRNLEVFRLKQISEPLDIFISHDWPSGVWDYGNKEQLIRFKPFFEEDIKNETLGSKPTGDLMNHLKPHYWFSAHLHCKFSALIPHSCGKVTKFLALDKCLPKRRFLQLMDIPHNTNLNVEISYDLEWLTILRLTNHLLSVKSYTVYMPGPNGTESSPTAEEKSVTLEKMGSSLIIPNNFVKTAPAHISRNNVSKTAIRQPNAVLNPQTELFCKKLGVHDPLSIILNQQSSATDILEGSTEISVDDSLTTFIEETDVSRSLDSSVNTRMSLSLPPPVNSGTEINILEEERKIEAPELPIEQESENKTLDELDNQLSNKRFKRRNANIYITKNDEGIAQ